MSENFDVELSHSALVIRDLGAMLRMGWIWGSCWAFRFRAGKTETVTVWYVCVCV